MDHGWNTEIKVNSTQVTTSHQTLYDIICKHPQRVRPSEPDDELDRPRPDHERLHDHDQPSASPLPKPQHRPPPASPAHALQQARSGREGGARPRDDIRSWDGVQR